MAAELTVLELGNPQLRQVAAPVTEVSDRWLQQFIDDLISTAHRTNGVGIAAPQVGHSLRLLIVASRPNLRYPQAPLMAPTALINPRLVAHGEEQVRGWEGCLSVPGIRGLVPRYREIEVEYLDRQGQTQRQVWQDFVARIFQHELDHLEGKVFVDRVESTADLMTEREYQARIIADL